MRFTTSALLFAATFIGSAIAAIDASVLTKLPTCAQAPLISGIANSGCDVTDIDCICGNADLMSSLQTAVKSACSAEDQERTLQLTGQICPVVSASAAATSAATSKALALTATTTPIMTDYPPATSTGLWTGTGTPTANLTATTGTYTAPTEPSVAPSTGAAGPRFQSGWLVIGLISLGGIFVGL